MFQKPPNVPLENFTGTTQDLAQAVMASKYLTLELHIASIVYGALWATKLRGGGYRRYTATSWILVAGPVVVALSAVALVALITADPSML
ncbi:hypothetical protein [Paenarthrobacter sp. NCHU4564]|uniref:hypothetical protein n=1 Tax=Paenarthrobacter sp. NCHU4564 TaxID=3451353 RepID=UPI003F98A296